MHIVFKTTDEWFEEHLEFQEEFTKTYKKIYEAAKEFASFLDSKVQSKAGISIKIEISEQLLKQSLVDAFDDLSRLMDYHPTNNPNPIKKMAYIGYWFVCRKPIRLVSEDIVINKKLSDIFRARLLFINEEFVIKLLMNAAFPGKREKDICKYMHEEANKQLKYYKKYLLYYLVYRMDSPKEIEAMMLGCTMHPVWEVDSIIWKEPKGKK